MAVSMKRPAENSAKIGGPGTVPRNAVQHFVVPPNGTKEDGEWHLAHNAADLVNIRGWHYGIDPRKTMAYGKPAGTEAPEAAPAADMGPDVAPAPAEVTKKAPDPVVVEFETLRAEAAALGVDVDARWGKTRLMKEIADAQAKKAAG